MRNYFSPEAKGRLHDLFTEVFSKPQLFPPDVNQFAFEMVERIDSFMQTLEAEKNYPLEEENMRDPHFDGSSYEKKLDQKRLARLHYRVFDYMMDGQWHTNEDIARGTGIPEGSASAKYRDFRKPQWGKHTVEKRRIEPKSSGLWEYRLIPNKFSLSWKHYEQDKASQAAPIYL